MKYAWRVRFGVGCLCVGLTLLFYQSKPPAAKGGPPPGKRKGIDHQLRAKLRNAGSKPLDPGPEHDGDKVTLGQMLFFDKELSGNRDIACVTCHHPFLATADALSLSIGTGGTGLGPFRVLGAGREFIPRNTPELFNRGSSSWHSQFWDSRIKKSADGGFISPAGDQLPDGLESVLAVQAMFPVLSRIEMRGAITDVNDVFGDPNELSQLNDNDLPGIWQALIDRLLSIEDYQDLFAAAYPDVDEADLGFKHASNVIAAFEAEAFTFLDSPFD